MVIVPPLSPPQGGPGGEGEAGAVGEPGLKVSGLTTASFSLESFVTCKLSEKTLTQPASVCPSHECGRSLGLRRNLIRCQVWKMSRVLPTLRCGSAGEDTNCVFCVHAQGDVGPLGAEGEQGQEGMRVSDCKQGR